MLKTLTSLTFILLFSTISIIIFAQDYEGQEVIIHNNGPCIPEATRQSVIQNTQQTIDSLGLNNTFNKNSIILFDWPVQQAAGFNCCNVYAITNYVDHNPVSTPNFGDITSLQDYQCGTITYDVAGYNHQGIDIATWPFGWDMMDNNKAEVVAAADGVIVNKQDGQFDQNCVLADVPANYVILSHPDGSQTWYWHLKNGSVTALPVGTAVNAGDYLGIVGSSGSSTGPHLHFEVYDPNGNLVDPYAGPCNSFNGNTSWWNNQKPYIDKGINQILTHNAVPAFMQCPPDPPQDIKEDYCPGEEVLFCLYLRHLDVNDTYTFSLNDNNGNVLFPGSNSPAIPNVYQTAYFCHAVNLPANAQAGTWSVTGNYGGESCTHQFTVQELDCNGVCGGPIVDTDNDGICNDVDCDDTNANVGAPQTIQASCDDGNTATINDQIQADGCTCMGEIPSCNPGFVDSDGDGICSDTDCDDGNANIGAAVAAGTSCNDNDPETSNDQIQADGCTCAGELPPLPDCDDLEPFQCTSDLYQVVNAQLNQFTVNPYNYTTIGPSYQSYWNTINAVGYNVQDNFLYGIGQTGSNPKHLIKIGSNGLMCDLGVLPNIPSTTYDSGDMDLNGNLIFTHNPNMNIPITNIYTIDVSSTPISVTTVGVGPYGQNDMAFNPIDGLFYSINPGGNTLFILDSTTGTINSIPVSPAINPCYQGGSQQQAFGAQYFDQTGTMYVSCNGDGSIYELDVTTGTWQLAVTTGVATNNNDGASCPLAAPAFVQDCPDIIQIDAPITVCSSSTLDIDVLVDSMSIGGIDYGLGFIASSMPINPYNGGMPIGSLTNNDLTNNGTNASISINPFSLIPGTNYIYVILNPVPADADCRSSANIIIEVLDNPQLSPTLNNTNTTFCKKTDAIISVSGATNNTFNWYSDAALTIPANGVSYGTLDEFYMTSLNTNGTETVYVTQEDTNGCQSEALQVEITLNLCQASGGKF